MLKIQNRIIKLVNGIVTGGSGSTASTTTSTATPGTPDTGFGVHSTNPWQPIVAYSLGAIAFIGLAFVTRRLSKSQ